MSGRSRAADIPTIYHIARPVTAAVSIASVACLRGHVLTLVHDLRRPLFLRGRKSVSQVLISDTERLNHLAQPPCIVTYILVWLCVWIFIRMKMCEGFMIVDLAGCTGGVGKRTTAVHRAAYLQTLAPTLLRDGDDDRNATT
jgi:hypothetical protein